MDQFETPEEAMKFGRSALAVIEKHSLPAYPRNYAVWYTYFSGTCPELNVALDEVLREYGTLPDEAGRRLYEHFFHFARLGKAVRRAGTQAQSSITRVIERIEDAKDATASFRDTIRSETARLGAEPSADLVAEVATRLEESGRAIEERHRDLESALVTSWQEIARLKQALEAVEREATTDPLTGLANRKQFDAQIRQAIIEAQEKAEALSLLMIDVDRFKHYNDSYGHQFGDHVLRVVARTLTDTIKGSDLACRFGGDEFAVLLPQTRLPDAARVADNIRAMVARRKLVLKSTGEAFGTVTLSVGVATFTAAEPASQLVQRADEALYEAKRAGRNRVVSAELSSAGAIVIRA